MVEMGGVVALTQLAREKELQVMVCKLNTVTFIFYLWYLYLVLLCQCV